jgi:hypothetical protein
MHGVKLGRHGREVGALAISTWHLSNFGKTRKIGLQQFGKPTWQK